LTATSNTRSPAGSPPSDFAREPLADRERRQQLRNRLLDARDAFAAGPDASHAATTLTRHLTALLHDLEPELLGLYWAVRSEFNAASAVAADPALAKLPRALPFARRMPVAMEFRAWDGVTPSLRDDCGIPSTDGRVVVPDVVLVPCVGFTAGGYRLGYGGGYFDRWLALNPGVTTVGLAWSAAAIDADAFQPLPHDRPLTLIVTERGVV
jgi:5-formyltetrahydrofolate cyclo-ligase